MSLKNKTIIISGASRGIGLAIAQKCAKDGANLVILGKTLDPHPKLPGTLLTSAATIKSLGGNALPIQTDIRFEDQVINAIEKTVETFGGIDICINNASAIMLTNTEDTPMKRYDLMNQVNARGTYLLSKHCIPHLKNSKNPHILNNSPPLNMAAKWFAGYIAYTIAKYGMSMCTLGMSEELKKYNIAVNSIWPKTAIATAAIEHAIGNKDSMKMCRTVDIMADAAYLIINKRSTEFTGNFCIDEDLLREHGVYDFSHYAVDPSATLMTDFYLD